MSPANGDAAGLERQIADLSPAQRALLERRLLRRGGAAGAASRIPSRADRGACPLSFAQQRLWFLAQLDPDSAAFNQPTALRLVGRLDRGALRGALQAVVDRHEMLRTTFGAVDGVPFQVVGPAPSVALPVVEVPAPDREEQLSEALRAEGRRPFDLSRDPMLRATLFALGPEEHALLVDVHHIAADGWSKGVLLQEVAAAYGALVRGEPAVMPALPIQYADYAVWQRERLQTTGIETDLAYWKSALEGAPAICDVPTDRPRRDPRGWQGDRVGTELSPALCRALREVSRGEQATLFTTLLAAYQAVLGRYAGQDDVLVAVPVAGRDRTETQGLIGILVNVLCFRADLSGNPSFRELLGRVRDVVLAGLGHQELPFERLVEELHPDRRMTHAPIVQVSFNLLPFEDRLPALEGLQVSRLPFDIEAVNYDLSLVAASDGDGLRIGLRFATDILSASTASRMLRHWVTLLEGVAADPSARVWSVPLLSAMERRQALVQWNPPPPAAAPPACLHELFEAQVARRPDAVALTCGAERFTYRELDARARGLAHVLRSKGVGPDVLVGLCVEPSLDLVVGLLAILKAGGAYLPLDPAYPAGRLAFMVEDARLAVVVVQKHLIDRLPAGPVTFVGVDEGVQPEDGGTAGRSPVHPDNLAYVIYTSGSSGQPKGVQVTHANVARLLSATEPWFGFDERDVWTLFHSFAFDFSVWELWGALAYGGRLVVVPYLTSRSPESFADLLRAEGVTVLNQTPSAFRQLAAADAARGDAGGLALRAVVFGGEALEPGALAPWVERHDDGAPRLVNMYGITETTVHVTYRPLAATEIRGGIGSVIGQPIPDLQVHVLDRVMEPAPVGVAGELYVGGRGLARGYLNRPDLTAERFVPDPFATDGGRRLYRTGDLGRRLPDGDVEYLGRADQQIKLRGFRIELGEIEAALRAVPGVGDATVGLTGGGTADASLLAHVVFDGPAAPAAELRAALRRTLPDYMIPAAFVPMAALPLTANGKLDRRALPAPVARAWDGDEAPAPVIDDALTRDVAAIWARVLRVPSVAPDDDFFDLGGHSLLAVRLAAEMGELAGGRFPVVTIFRAPTLDATVAALREMISHAAPEAALAEEAPAEAIPHRQGDGAARPLSFAQQRLWFLDQLEPGTASYNVPVALRLVGPLRVDALRGAIDTVVARHEALRTSFVVSDGGPAQVVNEPAALDLPVTDLARLAGPDRESALARLLAEEAHRPFDLARDLLVRPSLYSLGPEEHVLLLMMHHIGADAWSLGVLYRELGTAYAALAGGAAPALPPLTTQYADFAAWQRDWLRGTRLEQHVTYWKEALAGAPAMLDLPTDHPRREERTWRGARVSARVSPEVAERLQGLGRRQGATLFMVLAAAFQAVLCRHSGQDDIVVGVPIAGRDRLDTQGLIGLFLNAFCLRTDLSGNPTFLDLVDRVRAAAVSAYAHQALPFEKLVEELAPDRTLGRSPLFQVLFNLMEVEDNVLVLPGLAVSPVPIEFETSKYDLALSVSRRDGGLSAGLRYSSDLFTAATAERMLGHWMTLLEAVAAAPERRLLDLPLLGPAESRARAAQVARARPRLERSGFPRAALERSVGARFEEQARRHASRIAVRGRRHAWTYGELDRRANRLAHALVARGAAGGRVALLLGHDAPMMAGILGVLKAGCAYVPLDPFYPRERLVAVVADAQASTLVTESRHAPLAGELAPGGVEILDVDDPGPAARDDDPGVVVSPDALAYLLYTSGSTGRPKGVMQTHRNLLHHIRVYTDNLGLTPDDRLTLFASYAFDAALMDIFGALLNGARLCPWSVREDGLVGAPAWLRDEEITVFHSTPTLYRHFVASLGDGDGFPSVRSVVMGGEEVLRTDVAAFARHFAPGAVFVNGLGPTESTLALQCFLDRDSELPAGRVPVGDPVEDTEVVLLDEEGRAAASGEITIASPHVALGYWRQPEQTAQAFRPDPTDPARRVYRTGDLGRLRADGTLEFLGRKDFQVKIRGFRIEPGEIEAQLRSERTLREAVVVPRAERPGEQRLVAYVVPMPGAVVTAADLRGALQERLPDYMVPATFVTLDALPLTPTGKIDRLALPAPPPVDGARDQGDGAPQDGLERDLAEIWAKVLGVSSVGRHDNFFELGGHSLLALRLFADIERLTGRSLPLATVFRAPTIAELAARLRAEVVEHTTSLVPLQPRGALPPLYCVHQHTGHLFCYRHLVAHLGPEQPAFGLAPPGLDGMETPIDRIEHLAAHYLGAIRARQARGPYHLLGYCFGGVVAFEMAHQLLAQGEEVALLAMIETAWRPPLTRAQRWALRTRRRFGYELDLVRRRRPLERPPFAAFRLGSLLLEVATRGLSRRVEPESPDEETTFVDAAIERVAKAHTAARQRYRPSVYPGRIVLFRSANLPARHFGDPCYGWDGLAKDGIEVEEIVSSTPTLVDEPTIQSVAARLGAHLAAARTSP